MQKPFAKLIKKLAYLNYHTAKMHYLHQLKSMDSNNHHTHFDLSDGKSGIVHGKESPGKVYRPNWSMKSTRAKFLNTFIRRKRSICLEKDGIKKDSGGLYQ